MSDHEPRGFSRRQREGDERIRRKNLEGREPTNVVPLRRPAPRRTINLMSLAFNPVVLWTGIVVILIGVYLLRGPL